MGCGPWLSWGAQTKHEAASVRFPPVFVSESERRVQRAEQRALKAEEALQSASVQIGDLERKLQGPPRLSAEGREPPTWS